VEKSTRIAVSVRKLFTSGRRDLIDIGINGSINSARKVGRQFKCAVRELNESKVLLLLRELSSIKFNIPVIIPSLPPFVCLMGDYNSRA
jgi:hypothetical protein